MHAEHAVAAALRHCARVRGALQVEVERARARAGAGHGVVGDGELDAAVHELLQESRTLSCSIRDLRLACRKYMVKQLKLIRFRIKIFSRKTKNIYISIDISTTHICGYALYQSFSIYVRFYCNILMPYDN